MLSNPTIRVGADRRLAESSVSSRVSPRAATPSAFAHKRGRERLNLSWRFKLAAAGIISVLVAVSLLTQM